MPRRRYVPITAQSRARDICRHQELKPHFTAANQFVRFDEDDTADRLSLDVFDLVLEPAVVSAAVDRLERLVAFRFCLR